MADPLVRAALVVLLVVHCAAGCGESKGEAKVPKSEPRSVTLVQTVPTETSGFEARGVPHTYDVWLDMIVNARESVDIATFYVSNQKPGRLEPVLLAMEAAARRGVRVRLLVDASFADKYPDELARLEPKMLVRRLDLKSRTGGVQHAKYMVVDRRTLYVGSANLDWRALEHIHEIGVLIAAPEMAEALSTLFQLDWDSAGGSDVTSTTTRAVPKQATWPIVEAGEQRFTLLASPKGHLPVPEAWDLPQIIGVIEEARDSIIIQLLSYDAAHRNGAQWNEIHAALFAAAERGVSVRLALSHWQRKHMTAIRELQRKPGIDVALVEVPEHSSGFVPFARVAHAKYLVVDAEVTWIGTSNWKGDYFYTSRNVGVLIRGVAISEQLTAVFESVFGGPYATRVDPAADDSIPPTSANR